MSQRCLTGNEHRGPSCGGLGDRRVFQQRRYESNRVGGFVGQEECSRLDGGAEHVGGSCLERFGRGVEIRDGLCGKLGGLARCWEALAVSVSAC